MKWERSMKLLLLCLVLAVSVFALAGCGSDDPEEPQASGGTYEIKITGEEDNEGAVELLKLVNRYRADIGMKALKWNDEPAEMLRVRAAELAISFTDTRLNGTPGEEMFLVSCEDVQEGATQLLDDENFARQLQDPRNKSFCAGVYLSYSGQVYITAGFYTKTGERKAPDAASQERTFTLIARDEALNCHGQLMDQEMEPEDPNELYAGEVYYYGIFNENAADENNVEELIGMVAESSDPDVIAIDEYGDVEAKSAGTATLTVRPSKDSGIVFTQDVKVRK